MAFYELDDNMDLAEAFLKRIFRDVLERLRTRTCSSSTSAIDKTVLDRAGERRRAASSCRLPYTEAVDILQKSRQDVRVPGRVGQRPAGRARALPDREALQAPGDPVRLPADDQAVLHARERRRQDGAGDGRAGAGRRRDHRRQPARGAARRARSSG